MSAGSSSGGRRREGGELQQQLRTGDLSVLVVAGELRLLGAREGWMVKWWCCCGVVRVCAFFCEREQRVCHATGLFRLRNRKSCVGKRGVLLRSTAVGFSMWRLGVASSEVENPQRTLAGSHLLCWVLYLPDVTCKRIYCVRNHRDGTKPVPQPSSRVIPSKSNSRKRT